METTSQRVLLVANPNSAGAPKVHEAVRQPLLEVTQKHQLVDFHTPSPDWQTNVDAIAESLQDGDRIIVASGDGVVNQAVNALILSDVKDAQLAMLGYGGLNDATMAFTSTAIQKDPTLLVAKHVEMVDAFPIEVAFDEKLWRRALLYASIGQSARLVTAFDDPEVRAKVQKNRLNILPALAGIFSTYLKTRKEFLPTFTSEGEVFDHITDILISNALIMARVGRNGKNYGLGETFLKSEFDISGLVKNAPLLGRSAINLVGGHVQLPGREVSEARYEFNTTTDVDIQVEGDKTTATNVQSVSFKKSRNPIEIIRGVAA